MTSADLKALDDELYIIVQSLELLSRHSRAASLDGRSLAVNIDELRARLSRARIRWTSQRSLPGLHS